MSACDNTVTFFIVSDSRALQCIQPEEMILNKTIKVELHQIFSFHPSIGKVSCLKPLLFFDALELARFEMQPPALCGSRRTRAINIYND